VDGKTAKIAVVTPMLSQRDQRARVRTTGIRESQRTGDWGEGRRRDYGWIRGMAAPGVRAGELRVVQLANERSVAATIDRTGAIAPTGPALNGITTPLLYPAKSVKSTHVGGVLCCHANARGKNRTRRWVEAEREKSRSQSPRPEGGGSGGLRTGSTSGRSRDGVADVEAAERDRKFPRAESPLDRRIGE